MKKIITIAMCFVLIMSFAACNKRANTGSGIDEKNPISDTNVPEFKAKTLSGDEISNDVFKNNNLTLVNLWASWCEPCVAELPEFQKLYEAYKDKGINVIGLIAEKKLDSAGIDECKQVVEKSKVNYTNIVADKNLYDSIISKFDYVPVTLLVDSEGKILEKFIPGSTDYEALEALVKDYVKK